MPSTKEPTGEIPEEARIITLPQEETPRPSVQDIENILNQKENREEKSSDELFKEKDIKLRTDLNNEHIGLLTKIYAISRLADIPELAEIGDEFCRLRVSKDRKSRGEFVEANKNEGMNMNFPPMPQTR